MESEQINRDPGGGVAAGRIVHFVVGAGDLPRMQELGGNPIAVGDTLAATIVKAWGGPTGSTVNLKVHMDGPRDYWATSVPYADVVEEVRAAFAVSGQEFALPERTWHWPPRV